MFCSGGRGCGGKPKILLVAAVQFAALGLGFRPAAAEDLWRESGLGASAAGHSWVVYSSTTIALDSHLYADGWRLRMGAGYGGYTIRDVEDCLKPCKPVTRKLDGRATFSDVLVGYLTRTGSLTAKGFLGVSFNDQQVPALLSEDMPIGAEWGPMLVGELWYDPGGNYWASLNASFTTAHNTFALGSRLGLRLTPEWSVGPEFNLDRNGWQEIDVAGLESAFARAGLFTRYAWETGEISLAAGIARDVSDPSSPYASINWLSKF